MTDSIHIQQTSLLWLLALIPLLAAGLFLRRTERFAWPKAALLAVRMAALAIGVMALSDVRVLKEQTSSHVPAVYVLEDRSGSVLSDAAAAPAAEALVRRLPEGRSVERLQFAAEAWRPGEPAADAGATDVERALDRVGERALDLDGSDVILLTDGRATRGDPPAAARRLAARGAKVHLLPIGKAKATPSEIVGVEPPIGTRVGATAVVRATVRSSGPEKVTVRLMQADGKPADAREIPLDGEATLLLRAVPPAAGTAEYTLVVESEGRIVSRRPVQFDVESPPGILVVDLFPRDLAALARAIGEPGVPIDLVTPDRLPADLSKYAAVVLSDLPGTEFSSEQRLAIRQFVEDRGSGLVFIAGPNVMPSKWQTNPLEALLPVAMKEKPAKVEKKLPDVSICFVIDCSGSMGGQLAGGNGALSKLELVKSSVVASLDVLPESARVSVIAFDTTPTLVVDNASVANKAAITKLIDTIGGGGGTDIYPAAEMGLRTLQAMPGDRFVVLLTDGQSTPPAGRAWDDLAKMSGAVGARWTSIAVGDDADQQLLREMATRANGNYIFCRSADQVPRVFIDHAKSVRHVAETKQPAFVPRRGPDAAELPDLGAAAFPSLEGSLLSEPRPGARVQIVDAEGKPILASWKAGAGKVISYTSDVKNSWAREWLRWDQFARFWRHTIGSATSAPPPMHVSTNSFRRNDMQQFRFTITESSGQPADGVSARAVRPDGRTIPIDWKQGQPGVYTARVNMAGEPDNLPVRFSIARPGSSTIHYTAMIPASQDQESVTWGPDWDACREIALAGNGVCSTDPSAIVSLLSAGATTRSWTESVPMWPWLIAALLLLWPIDVWCRKVMG